MRTIPLWIILLLPQIVFSQFVLEKNIDLLLPGSGQQYGVVPAETDGVVVFNETKSTESLISRKWEITHFNTDLEPIWKSFFESEYNFKITHVKYSEGNIYLLFQDINVPMKEIIFVRVNILKYEFEFFEINEFLPKEIISFEILGNSLFLVGNENKRISILKFEFGDTRPLVLTGLHGEYNDLLHTEVLPESGLLQIITRMKKQRGSNTILLLKQYNESGEVQKSIIVESSKGYDLIDARAQTDQEGNTCVVGTFSYGRSKLSSGIFTTILDQGGEHPLYYYDYTNLHNYFNFLSGKEKEKTLRKFAADGRNNKKSNYRVNHEPREVMKSADGWTFIGEILKLTERNSRIYGNMWSMEYRQYSHAVILGIDKDGMLQWDNSFNLDGLSTVSDLRQVYSSSFGKYTIMYHLNNEEVIYKIIDKSTDLVNRGHVKPQNANLEFFEEENARNYNNIFPWYNNNILTMRALVINSKPEESRKYIFLNKISITPATDQISP